jgi:hypothetical protein
MNDSDCPPWPPGRHAAQPHVAALPGPGRRAVEPAWLRYHRLGRTPDPGRPRAASEGPGRGRGWELANRDVWHTPQRSHSRRDHPPGCLRRALSRPLARTQSRRLVAYLPLSRPPLHPLCMPACGWLDGGRSGTGSRRLSLPLSPPLARSLSPPRRRGTDVEVARRVRAESCMGAPPPPSPRTPRRGSSAGKWRWAPAAAARAGAPGAGAPAGASGPWAEAAIKRACRAGAWGVSEGRKGGFPSSLPPRGRRETVGAG